MKRTFQYIFIVAPQVVQAFAPSHSFLVLTRSTRAYPSTIIAHGGVGEIEVEAKGTTVVGLKAALKARGLKVWRIAYHRTCSRLNLSSSETLKLNFARLRRVTS